MSIFAYEYTVKYYGCHISAALHRCIFKPVFARFAGASQFTSVN